MFDNAIVGSTVVGERGQIVLPVDIRRACRIQPGQTLVVAAVPSHRGFRIFLVKPDTILHMMDGFEKARVRLKEVVENARVRKGGRGR